MKKILKFIFGVNKSAENKNQLQLNEHEQQLKEQQNQIEKQNQELLVLQKKLEELSSIQVKEIVENVKNNTLVINRNKILEILELKKEEDPVSLWLEGYPEQQWEILCRLRNGEFIENDREISFFTSNNEKIGLTKDFIYERDKNFAKYGSGGTYHITKDLLNTGVFEITDRVGNYIKLLVEQSFTDNTFNEHILYSQIFNKEQLALISDGFLDNWFVSRDSIGLTYIKKISQYQYKLYFESIELLQSKLGGYKFSGVISLGGEYHDWLEIIDLLDTVVEERGLKIEYIESLEKYNHHNYL
ncbi:MAG: hypothetical protein KA210_00755 [Bacteroidia bacterium]|nr:hypothetical protein [Bacteroidia bacterium]